MDNKQKAYELFLQGKSYGQISHALNISKGSAFNYVNEMRNRDKRVQTRSNKGLNGNLNDQNARFERSLNDEIDSAKIEVTPGNKTLKPSIKEFTGDDLLNKQFDCLEFEGPFLDLIGKPSRLFSGIIWGLPKGGKSNLALRFADYLQEYFGNVVYIAAEEGESATLQEKFRAIDGSRVTVAESRNKQEIRKYLKEKPCDFIFIDSINNAGIDNDYLEVLKLENPSKSFVSVVQATKGGNFKGDQALTHNCDFIIKVIDGVAYHTGRFNNNSEIRIFETPLYHKNPQPHGNKKEIDVTTISPKISPEENVPYDLEHIDAIFWPKLNRLLESKKEEDLKNTHPISENISNPPIQNHYSNHVIKNKDDLAFDVQGVDDQWFLNYVTPEPMREDIPKMPIILEPIKQKHIPKKFLSIIKSSKKLPVNLNALHGVNKMEIEPPLKLKITFVEKVVLTAIAIIAISNISDSFSSPNDKIKIIKPKK